MTRAKDQAKNPWDYMGAEERRILCVRESHRH